MQKLSQAMGGTYTPAPDLGRPAPAYSTRRRLVITHPLGGCRIGPTMAEGVVNEFGEVYDGSKKTTDPRAVHPGFFMVDGARLFRARLPPIQPSLFRPRRSRRSSVPSDRYHFDRSRCLAGSASGAEKEIPASHLFA